tara:strand:+ start:104443 stop:105387 length:945 start_codon:yes stop_codon:yes gene_type:complete
MPFSVTEKAHAQKIKQLAQEFGFLDCGIVKADFLPKEAERLKEWLSNEYHGEMKYMENHFEKRVNPAKLVENTKSVIVLTYNYYPTKKQREDSYKIAKYAYGKDYHFILKEKLQKLWLAIENTLDIKMQGRIFVDSAPVLERSLAQQAGLGWIGKNTMLISKQKGSFFFISELFVDIPLAYDTPFKTDHCGTCTRCIEACPTDAILPGKTLNAKQCISYFTIELKDENLSAHVNKKWDDWIFGCDICQDVCPWNRFATPHNEPAFEPDTRLLNFSKSDWENLSKEEFNQIFKKSAVKRTKYSGLMRNIKFLKEN